MTQIRVLVADAQRLFAQALAAALRRRHDLEVLPAHPTTGVAALAALEDHHPEVAVLDFWLREMDGPALLRAVRARTPEVAVLSLSWMHASENVLEALAAGAGGFLAKDATVGDVAGAVARIKAGETPVLAEDYAGLVGELEQRGVACDPAADRLAGLSPREVEVIRALSSGVEAAAVGSRLFISESTVRRHIHNMLEATGTGSREELVRLARAYGVVP